jgi:FkbM family methyltransferase
VQRIIKKLRSVFNLSHEQKPTSNQIWSVSQDASVYKAESEKLEWLKEYKLCTILDIGANEGQFAQKISFAFPHVRLLCFEPLKESFERLVKNVGHIQNAEFYHFALGATESRMSINKNEYSPSSSLLDMLDLHKSNFNFAVAVEAEEIEIRRLDDIEITPLEHPLLIKIDVQGYEMNVIKGGPKIINSADVVIIETSYYPLYKDQPLFDDIYKYFINHGFQFAGNIDQLIAPSTNKILQGDAVFIKADQMSK